MLIIIRGLPGSGKSTLARQIIKEHPSFVHYESDNYFIKNGEYQFDASQLKNAHNWCQQQVFNAINNILNVIVSNTFTQIWEMIPYINYAKSKNIKWTIIECNGKWKNIHSVPEEILEKMKQRYESIELLKKENGWFEYKNI